jgi:hypothetical protein
MNAALSGGGPSSFLKTTAQVISLIFHPVFVPLYVVLFSVYVHPYLFVGMQAQDKLRVTMMAALMFSFFPLVTTGLLKALGFIQSVYLKEQKDRIIPLVACGVFYFWIAYIWWNSNKISDYFFIPPQLVYFAIGVFIASWLALMINVKIKISLHAIAMGAMLTFVFQLAFSGNLNFGLWTSIAILTAGLVCTARFIASDHQPAEIYGGLITGVFSALAGELIGKIL